jgi:hypothetical protein
VTERPDDPDRPATGAEPPQAWGSPAPPPPAPPAYGPQQPGYGPQQPPPYGSQQPGYGPQQPVYGSPPPPYGAAPYRTETPEQSSLRTQAIVSLVINVIVVLSTCFAALPSIGGAITAGIAIGQVGSDPDNARKLVKWSWGLLIATIVLGVLVVVGFIVLVALIGSSTDTSTTTGY